MNGLALCTGIGGLELGLGMVVPDYRTVCAVEREAYPAAILAQRQKDEALHPFPVWDDLATFDGKPWRGVVDIVTGGIPCQPFSYAGKRKGGDDERNLWPEALRIVGEVRPALAFFENVPGVEQYYFNQVWPELHQLGYEVAEGIFSAAEVGASHRRERVFILAYGRREHVNVQQWAARPELETEGNVLAYSNGPRPQGRSISRDSAGERAARTSSPKMGDSKREGLEGKEYRISKSVEQSSRGFPPGPDDLEGWSRLLTEMPSLEPAICRVADELPCRVDRLAALGNAVVPTQAAYAFTTLRGKLVL